nr:malonyl-coenzyme A:anthocyanin 3-O-glucoside-6''-O-malonyltransferase-like [Tanacetum cinerariifolium]
MELMVERNRGEYLIRRFAGRGNEPDLRDVKIASLKQRIQELEFSQLHRESPAEEAKTESNVWDDGSEDVNHFGRGNPGFHDDHYDNQEEGEEEESMPVYDTDIEDVIEKEEGFIRKGGFCGEEDNIEDAVVVANDLCFSMIQTILSVDFEKDINTKSHELMSFEKSIIIKSITSMASYPILTVLEKSPVSPPPATVADKSLSLIFFDFFWLRAPSVHNLFFYELPLTKTEFLETIVPSLKNSLSITLQHFFPFVGNLFIYPSPKTPEIRYVEGDSIAVTFAECHLDFDDLTGNHPRVCDKFYHLIPLLGQPEKASDYTKLLIFAVQVSFFPNRGFSIGMTNHHTLGDASTRFCFLKAWISVTRSGTDESFLANGSLPIYDSKLLWQRSYRCFALEKPTMLTEKEGFIHAAKLLGERLHSTLTNKNGVFKDLESDIGVFADGVPTTIIGVAGTPKLKFYDIDFGWGRPKKVETVSIDYNGSISMNACKESNDDLEIGVCLPVDEMKTFVRTFENGLQAFV